MSIRSYLSEELSLLVSLTLAFIVGYLQLTDGYWHGLRPTHFSTFLLWKLGTKTALFIGREPVKE